MSEGDTIYSTYDVSHEFNNKYHMGLRDLDNQIADYFLCKECFVKLLDEIHPGAGAEQRKFIEENRTEDSWHFNDLRRPWEIDD